jgi:hypothetical protein
MDAWIWTRLRGEFPLHLIYSGSASLCSTEIVVKPSARLLHATTKNPQGSFSWLRDLIASAQGEE